VRHAIFVIVLLLSACGSSRQAEPEPKRESPAVAKAKLDAKEISIDAWIIEQIENPSTTEMVLVLSNHHVQITLKINGSHLGWHLYSRLHALPKGAKLRFDYEPKGFNEASDLAPENDQNPAFYLVPREA
jgi:hypothetical protein